MHIFELFPATTIDEEARIRIWQPEERTEQYVDHAKGWIVKMALYQAGLVHDNPTLDNMSRRLDAAREIEHRIREAEADDIPLDIMEDVTAELAAEHCKQFEIIHHETRTPVMLEEQGGFSYIGNHLTSDGVRELTEVEPICKLVDEGKIDFDAPYIVPHGNTITRLHSLGWQAKDGTGIFYPILPAFGPHNKPEIARAAEVASLELMFL